MGMSPILIFKNDKKIITLIKLLIVDYFQLILILIVLILMSWFIFSVIAISCLESLHKQKVKYEAIK